MRRLDPDRELLRRARRSLALRHTLVFAVILVAVGAVALLVEDRQERSALAADLRHTAAGAGDVGAAPDGTWIFRLGADGGLLATAGAPPGFPDRAALDRVRAGGGPEQAQTEDYVVVTVRQGGDAVQVVGSFATDRAELRRLLAALGTAGLLGLLAAVVAGWLLARRAVAPLGEALARQRRFVADASHELRTPIAQLHTRAQLLERDLRDGGGGAAHDAGRLVAGARQLGEIVEDLLLSTHPDGPTGPGAEVDLGVLADAVVTGFAERARAGGVEVALHTDPDRPSIVAGREPALRRVLTGLIDNALRHTPPGGHVGVVLDRSGTPPLVRLVVRDDGAGFEPADAERIFARFARGHDDHRRFGLGLALAREVVSGHGGTIEAHGEPGAGATFTVRLPAADA